MGTQSTFFFFFFFFFFALHYSWKLENRLIHVMCPFLNIFLNFLSVWLFEKSEKEVAVAKKAKRSNTHAHSFCPRFEKKKKIIKKTWGREGRGERDRGNDNKIPLL